MGKRDYWPYDKDYWQKWSEHNSDYWKKWAEHNKNYWNHHGHHYARHCGRGRWLGRIIFLGVGFAAGMMIAKRHQLPSADPHEAWERMKYSAEKVKEDTQNFRESAEFSEILDKIKQFEKRLRRPQPSDEKQPASSEDKTPKSSE